MNSSEDHSSMPVWTVASLPDDVEDVSIHAAVKRMLDAIFGSLLEAELARSHAQAPTVEKEADVAPQAAEAGEAAQDIVSALVSKIFSMVVTSIDQKVPELSTGRGVLNAESAEETQEAIVREATGLIFASVLAAHGEQPRGRRQYTR
jgi:hypothetical protein